MEDKSFAREPLLYIHQPKIEKPTASMQYHYHTPKQQINLFDQHGLNDGQNRINFDENLKFNELTLRQKVEYFINKPNQVPKVKCLLRTNDKTYQGIITAFENNEVHLQTGIRSNAITQIPFDQINRINIVGF